MMTQAQRDSLITPDVLQRTEYVTNNLLYAWRVQHRVHDDVRSAANLGLVIATRRFREQCDFWPFAYVYIKYHIIDELREQLGKTDRYSERTIAIKRPIEFTEVLDQGYHDDRIDRFIDRDFIFSLTDNKRTREILFMRLLGFTEPEIGQRFSISASRVSQIISRIPVNPKRTGSDSFWLKGLE